MRKGGLGTGKERERERRKGDFEQQLVEYLPLAENTTNDGRFALSSLTTE
jgi:hypothetical protein